MTPNAPPGRIHGAEKDRTALCDVASTGVECNRPATPTTATATANNANGFLIKARSFSLPLSLPQPIQSAGEVELDDRYRLFLGDTVGEVIDHRLEGLVTVDHFVLVHVVGTQVHIGYSDGHGDGRAYAR